MGSISRYEGFGRRCLCALLFLGVVVLLCKKEFFLKNFLEEGLVHDKDGKILEEIPRVSSTSLEPRNQATGTAPPCGHVCDITAPNIKGGVTKQFNCTNIFLRLRYPDGRIYKPPLRSPPKHLLSDFLQNNTMKNYENRKYFDDAGKGEGVKVFKATVVKNEGLGYERGGTTLRDVLLQFQKFVSGKSGVVIGTQTPWIESLLIRMGAHHVTTLDYQPILYEHPQLTFVHAWDIADNFLAGRQPQFDFAVSFSSIEHSGLGRYGDPLNPYGDFEAVAQVWCMLREGGAFVLALPGCKHDVGELYFNGRRSYGEGRWRQLAANFDELLWRRPSNDTYNHEICVLQKP